MKKVVALLLVIAVIICPIQVSIRVQAAGESDLTFKLNEDGTSYYVAECSENASGEIVIPEIHNGKPVERIGFFAFENAKELVSITIPGSVTTIEQGAFSDCTNLVSVIISDGVRLIGSSVFRNCKNLTSVTIPDSVTSIGNAAFDGCTSLQYNTYDNAKYLGNSHNPYVVLVESISDTIKDCKIHTSCKIIGAHAFESRYLLSTINIPDGVVSIGDCAFTRCSKLTNVAIPDSVTSIGGFAFSECRNLTNVAISNSITSIPNYSFHGCQSLLDVTIPDRVKYIGLNAFTYCADLTSVIIPDSVTDIGIQAFAGCDSLADIYYEGTQTQWASIDIDNDNAPLKNAMIHYNCSSASNDAPSGECTDHVWDSGMTNSDGSITYTCTICGYQFLQDTEGTTGNKVLKKVFAYSSTQEDGFWLQLLDVDGTAYILDIDATLVAPNDEVQFTPNGATYVYGKHTVKYTGNIETYNGGEYYNLRELMDLLNVRYDYVAESQTIMFNSATSYKENLIEDCDSIYADDYGLDYLDNPAYYGLGAAYNIIGGFRIDFLWGNYQTEMREEVVVNIMAADQNAESFVDLLNKGDSFAKKAITVYKGLNDATSGIERYSDLLDCPEAEWLKAYDKVSKGGGVFGFSDFLDIAQLAYDAQGAYSTYATAVKYGLVKNNNMKYVGDDCLKTAANNVYSYYEQETHVFSDMLADTVKTAGNNITTKAVKDIIKRGTGYKGNITKLVKLFADEVLQMKEMTTAVEHTHICATIQEAAMLQYKASNDPLTKKYCTILYLRACQYAYSLYEFDPTLSWSAEYWKDKTQQAIETLVVYSDAELSRTVKNDKLDMTHEGFVTISGDQN